MTSPGTGSPLLQQFMDLYFLPEIARRSEQGTLPPGFRIHAAQVVFHPDGRATDVRLNDEIRAITKVRLALPPGAIKRPGEPVLASEIAEVSRIQLTPDEDPDAGHATFLLVGNAWHVGFDLRYNRSAARRHIDAARQFLRCAEVCLAEKLWVALIDNLFSAAELTAKATLLFIPDPAVRKSRKHSFIHSAYNRFANLGNVRTRHRNAFNDLSRLRPQIRYLHEASTVTPAQAKRLFASVSLMIEEQERFYDYEK